MVPLEASTVRIFAASRDVVGAGFMVSDQIIVTCAHVVAASCGLQKDHPTAPQTPITLDFPLLASGRTLTARVIRWVALKSDGTGDIAILQLESNVPDGAKSIRLVKVDDHRDHLFRAFGFPDKQDDGIEAGGKLSGKNANGWVQMDHNAYNFRVQQGLSGGAVWDQEVNGVVGIVAAEATDPNVRVGWMIPAQLLIDAWPDLGRQAIQPSPYRGLFAFQERDAPYFFGREASTQALVVKAQRHPLAVVIGPSGSGKSSLVFAGLLPYLRKEGNWVITPPCRPGRTPLLSLANTLIPLLEMKMSERQKMHEAEALAADLRQGMPTFPLLLGRLLEKQGAERLLIIIDPLEEIYTDCQVEKERQQFLDALLTATQHTRDGRPQVVVVCTLRVDFLGQVLAYRPFTDALQQADLKLGPMTRSELEQAINKPSEKLHVRIQQGLTERILDAIGQEAGNLPLLEFALAQLWMRQQEGELTHAAYEEIGGVRKALTDHAETVWTQLRTDEQEAVKNLFIQLVRLGEGTAAIGRRVTRTMLGEPGWRVVPHLANERLVVTGRDPGTGQETVEMIHEALIYHWERLRRWIEDDRDYIAWLNRVQAAQAEWGKSEKDAGALLRGALLGEALDWMGKRAIFIPLEVQSFISASQEQAEREEKLLKELADERDRQLQRWTLVHRIIQHINKTLDLANVLETILQSAKEQLVAEKDSIKGSILLYNPDTQMLKIEAFIGAEQGFFRPNDVRLDQYKGITRWVFERKQSANVANVRTDPRWRDLYIETDSDMFSELDVPLMDGTQVIGIISFESTQEGAFTPEDQAFLELLAGQAVLAINNARAHGDLGQRRQRELELAHSITQQMSRTLDLNQVLHIILDEIKTNIPLVHKGSILLYDAPTHSLVTKDFLSDDPNYQPTLTIPLDKEKGITRWVFEEKQPIRVANVRTDPRWKHLYIGTDQSLLSELDVPLMDGERVVGVLNFESREEDAFTQANQEFLVTLAEQAVFAINNAQIHGDLSQRRRHELELVRAITQQMSRTLDPKYVLYTMLDGIKVRIPLAFKVAILLYNQATQALDTEAFRSEDPAYQQAPSIYLTDQKGITRWVFEHKEPANVANVLTDPRWRDIYLKTDSRIRAELDVPLLDEQRAMGVISLGSVVEGAFTRADQEFLVTLADQVVIVIKNSQEYGHLRERRIEELELLQSIDHQISSTLDRKQILRTILKEANQHLQAINGSILLYNEHTQLLETADYLSSDPHYRQNIAIPVNEGIGFSRWVYRQAMPLRVENVRTTRWRDRFIVTDPRIISAIGVPLKGDKEVMGTLFFGSDHEAAFTQEDEGFLVTLASHAVLALKNAEAFERERQTAEERQTLIEMLKRMTGQANLSDLFEPILEKALEHVKATLGALLLYDSEHHNLWIAAEKGLPTEQERHHQQIDEGIIGEALRQKKILNVGDVTQPPWDEYYLELLPGIHSELVVPLLEGEGQQVLGVINLESKAPAQFTPRDEEQVQALANLAVIAIQLLRSRNTKHTIA